MWTYIERASIFAQVSIPIIKCSKSHCKHVYPSYRYLSFLNQKDANTVATNNARPLDIKILHQQEMARTIQSWGLITYMLKSEMKCYNDCRILSRKTLIFWFFFQDGLDLLVPGNLKSPSPNSSTVLKSPPKSLES